MTPTTHTIKSAVLGPAKIHKEKDISASDPWPPVSPVGASINSKCPHWYTDGECGKEVRKRAQVGLQRCQPRWAIKEYQRELMEWSLGRAVMLSGVETVGAQLEEVAEMKMLSWTWERYVREARLRSFGNARRRDSEYRGRRMQESWRKTKEEILFV